jgi:hypothetical protein
MRERLRIGIVLGCLGWMAHPAGASWQTAAAAASVRSGGDAVIDTRPFLDAVRSGPDAATVDTRLNFVIRSAAPGVKIDTLKKPGLLMWVK